MMEEEGIRRHRHVLVLILKVYSQRYVLTGTIFSAGVGESSKGLVDKRPLSNEEISGKFKIKETIEEALGSLQIQVYIKQNRKSM